MTILRFGMHGGLHQISPIPTPPKVPSVSEEWFKDIPTPLPTLDSFASETLTASSLLPSIFGDFFNKEVLDGDLELPHTDSDWSRLFDLDGALSIFRVPSPNLTILMEEAHPKGRNGSSSQANPPRLSAKLNNPFAQLPSAVLEPSSPEPQKSMNDGRPKRLKRTGNVLPMAQTKKARSERPKEEIKSLEPLEGSAPLNNASVQPTTPSSTKRSRRPYDPAARAAWIKRREEVLGCEYNKYVKLRDELRKQGVKIPKQVPTPMSTLTGLLKKGSVSYQPNSRLFQVIQQVKLKNLKACIAAGEPVNVVDDEGKSPLYLACLKGSLPMVDVLLKAGANTNPDPRKPPLHFATASGQEPIISRLLEAGADVNATIQGNEQTALHWVGVFGKQSRGAVTLLLKYGADMDRPDAQGNTPWDIAVKYNQQAILHEMRQFREHHTSLPPVQSKFIPTAQE